MLNQKKRRCSCLIEAVEPRLLFRTVFVDPNSPAPLRDGMGWSTAYNSYDEAMIYAATGDELRFADAVFKPTATTNRNTSFTLRNGLMIKGGYAGYGAANPDARDPSLYQTVFSGDIGIQGDASDNSYHVFRSTTGPAGTRSTYDGIVVTGGNASGPDATSESAQGGATHLTPANFINCSFIQNQASLGGAIYGPASGSYTNCNFTNNTAMDGGAIYTTATDTAINLCTFTGNSATRDGGAVYAPGSFSMLTCSFTANSAANRGGAIANAANVPITLAVCTFTRNSAATGGAVDIATGGASSINRCIFNGNIASGLGGGIRALSATLKLMNSAFASNSANAGGAFSTNGAQSPLILNCTMTGNVATQITRHFHFTGAVPSIVNSIIWDPSSLKKSTYPNYDAYSVYSNVPGGVASAHNVDVDPLFMRNPSPGADGVWSTSDDDYGDLRIFAYSPMVDAADGVTMAQNASGDRDAGGGFRYRNVPSVVDTGTGGSPVADIGAYEALATRIAATTGPYAGVKQQQLTLTAMAASTVVGSLQFAWDFNGDGLFDDATGASPTYTIPVLPDNTLLPIAVRVTDGASVSFVGSTTVRVAPDYVLVDSRATGANDGSTWSNAFVSLQNALAAAVPGQEIHVATGTYKPTTTSDRNASFELRNGFKVRGGYAGLGNADPNLRDMATYPTILSGNIGAAGANTDNSRHVVIARGLDASTLLDGFTIADGYNGGGSGPTLNAGGMLIEEGAPTIQSCIFTRNAGFYGGAVAEYSASSTFKNCIFISTVGGYNEPAVYEKNCNSTFQGCTFTTDNLFAALGIYAEYSSVSLDGCIFAERSGCGASMYRCSSINVKDTVFVGNQDGAFEAYDCLSVNIYGCIFSGNSNNSVAAVRIDAGNAVIANCTLVDNNHYFPALTTSGGNATIANCVFWSTFALTYPQISTVPGVTLVVSSSDIQGGFVGIGNINADPIFIRVPAAGADGKWGTNDDDYGDLRLQAGSPCIDSGDNSLVPAGTVTDLAGNARFVDSPGVNDPGVIVDMGAYERQLPIYATGATLQTDGASPAVNVSFNVPLSSASISASDLVIQAVLGDGSLGGNLPVTAFSYDPVTRSISFSIPATVADGNYRATLAAGSVADAEGNAVSSTAGFDFFTLAGDANHDRKVDINDLAALAANWQGNSKTFSQGDFDYNGIVDSGDLAILAGNWQKTLAPPAPAAPVSTRLAPPKRTATRVASLVL